EWRQRLFSIATSTTDSTVAAGVCGTCLLHSYQMLAELEEYYPGSPLTSGGYFFDTRPNRDPMISFHRRYPFLYNFLEDVPQRYGTPLTPSETDDEINLRIARSMTEIVLPHFMWEASNIATDRGAIMNSIQELLSAPSGTSWISFLISVLPDGSTQAHAMPILRTSSGLVVVPTNLMSEFHDFVMATQATMNAETVYDHLSQQRTENIIFFATLRLGGIDANSLNSVMSQNNCTGDGQGRRGNRRFPGSSLVNQCVSGRCAIF
ncbi:DUF1561 family protein, partial [Bartonella sp. F02]|uniref:DUF1561 family protein n=1 Tax=Bartonella sp. F02 TaxID=2967262 RepID=UPI0022A9C872